LVIVGIGTSLPELSINIASAFDGSLIGLETIVGSTTFNVLFILGFSAVLYPLALKEVWVRRDIAIDLAAVALAALIITLPVLGDDRFLGIARAEGWLLGGLLLAWMVYMYRQRAILDDGIDVQVFTLVTSLVLVIAGIVGVFVGGRWVVDGASTIAGLLGISKALIALTAVAIGTSLPELTVSVVAVFKKQTGLAVGSIIGSNIFNFLGILGFTALLRPIATQELFRFDIMASLGAIALLLALTLVGTRYTITRSKGALLIGLYIVYLVVIIVRG